VIFHLKEDGKMTRWLIAWLLLLLPLHGVYSQLPDGELTFQVTNPGSALYDLSGDYEEWVEGVYCRYSIQTMPDGSVTGAGLMQGDIDWTGIYLDIPFTISGALSGPGTAPNLTLRMQGAGIVTYLGQTYPTKLLIRLLVKADTDSRQMLGKLRTTVNISGRGKGTDSARIALPMPDEADGTWSLTMVVAHDAKGRPVGPASATLANGHQPLAFTLKGKEYRRTGKTSLVLTGNRATGTRGQLNLTLLGGPQAQLDRVKGKLLGQTVK
jgi:hypothetical protein